MLVFFSPENILGDCGTKCKYLNQGVDMWVNGVEGIVQHLLRSPVESGESVLRHQSVNALQHPDPE